MAVTATIGSALIGAGAGIYSSRQASAAQKDLYNAQYAAESQAAIANAEAALRAAEYEAGSILAGAEAAATGTRKAAAAEAQALRKGAAAQSQAAATAADAAYGEAYRNVGLMKQEADESLRRLGEEQTQYEEKARARAAASGGEYTGSTQAAVEGLISENTKQYGYLKSAYANQRSVARSNANAERNAAYKYASAINISADAEAEATLKAGDAIAHATMQGAREQAYAVGGVAKAQQSATYKAYGGPTSGKWFNTAFANAAAARKRGAPFKAALGASSGYEYAAAKAYGRV